MYNICNKKINIIISELPLSRPKITDGEIKNKEYIIDSKKLIFPKNFITKK
jgi:hypothetical protein